MMPEPPERPYKMNPGDHFTCGFSTPFTLQGMFDPPVTGEDFARQITMVQRSLPENDRVIVRYKNGVLEIRLSHTIEGPKAKVKRRVKHALRFAMSPS